MLKKDILKITLAIIFAYNIIPIANRLSPATEIYTFLTDLWLANSICALVCSLLFCKKYGFKIWISFLIAILFMPTMLIFYNSSAFIFAVVYLAISIIGSTIGTILHKLKDKQ